MVSFPSECSGVPANSRSAAARNRSHSSAGGVGSPAAPLMTGLVSVSAALVLGDGRLESVEALTLPCQPKRRAGQVVDDGAQSGGFGADVVDVGIGAGDVAAVGAAVVGIGGVTGVVGAGCPFTQRGRGVEHARHAPARIDFCSDGFASTWRAALPLRMTRPANLLAPPATRER